MPAVPAKPRCQGPSDERRDGYTGRVRVSKPAQKRMSPARSGRNVLAARSNGHPCALSHHLSRVIARPGELRQRWVLLNSWFRRRLEILERDPEDQEQSEEGKNQCPACPDQDGKCLDDFSACFDGENSPSRPLGPQRSLVPGWDACSHAHPTQERLIRGDSSGLSTGPSPWEKRFRELVPRDSVFVCRDR